MFNIIFLRKCHKYAFTSTLYAGFILLMRHFCLLASFFPNIFTPLWIRIRLQELIECVYGSETVKFCF
jgi:hypothetical protein